MFLPEITQETMDKYLAKAREAGELVYMQETVSEIKRENPALYTIMSTSVLVAPTPHMGTVLLSHYCMIYKLLRIQAEDDLMSRLFRNDTE